MNILETFYILFKSDSEEVKQGAEEAKKSTDDLEASLTEITEISDDLGESLQKLAIQAAGFLGGLFALYGLRKGMTMTADYSEKVGLLSQSLAISAEEMAAWGEASKRFGGSAEALQGTLAGLNQSLFELYLTGQSNIVPALLRLGINFSDLEGKIKRPLDLLPEIAKAFERLPKQETLALGKQLGIDEGTIRLLQSGKANVDEFIRKQKELGVVTAEDAEISRKFNNQVRDTGQIFGQIFRTINTFVLPPLTSMLEIFEDLFLLFRNHGTFATIFITSFVALATAALIPTLIRISIAAAAALAPFIIAAAPFIGGAALITAAAVAIALLWEDLIKYAEGGKSVIGDARKAWDEFLDSLFGADTFFQKAIDRLKELWKAFKENPIQTVIDLFKNLLKFIPGSDLLFDLTSQIGGEAIDQINDLIAKGKQTVMDATNSPVAALPSGTFVSRQDARHRSNNVHIGTMNIQTKATDAEGIAHDINSAIREEMTKTQEQFDDGVDR